MRSVFAIRFANHFFIYFFEINCCTPVWLDLFQWVSVLAWSVSAQQVPASLNPLEPALQYHVQTDQGDERFFRFQTESGQYRNEKRHPDGSVTGSYGWVDPTGVLRLFDYVSDAAGYRIVKQQLIKVQLPAHIQVRVLYLNLTTAR